MRISTIALATALIAAFNVSHSAALPLREQPFVLSIEKASIASAMEQLSQQTGLHIGAEINVANSRVAEVGPFEGRATTDEALKELLKGTDLWYAWRDEDTIRLFHVSAQRIMWTIGVDTAERASQAIRSLAGIGYQTEGCSDFSVGPFSSNEAMTAEAFWVELIRPHCRVVRKPTSDKTPGSLEGPSIAGQTEHSFSIPAMSRLHALRRISEQAGMSVGYVSTDVEEEVAAVDPISGQMSLNQALSRAMRGSVLLARWTADDMVSIEPAYTMTTYADMSRCPCSFGFPELWPLQSEHLTVSKSRLPSLEEDSPAPKVVFERTSLEASGAATLPELLEQLLPEQPFSQSRGYRANCWSCPRRTPRGGAGSWVWRRRFRSRPPSWTP
jgi:hypothetical protein